MDVVRRLLEEYKSSERHGRAIIAVARNLAEASYWMLKKREPYRPPRIHHPSSQFGHPNNRSPNSTNQIVQSKGVTIRIVSYQWVVPNV